MTNDLTRSAYLKMAKQKVMQGRVIHECNLLLPCAGINGDKGPSVPDGVHLAANELWGGGEEVAHKDLEPGIRGL